MRWSKIKNIIILLLAVVNVCLLAMVGLRVWRSEQSQRETRRRIVAVMERNEIAFLPQEVPGTLELTGTRVTLTAPGREEAALLVGEASGTEVVGAQTTYRGSGGTVTVTASGSLTAQLEAGAFPLDGTDPGPAGLALLEQLGFRGRETGRETVGERTEVTYVQLWDGAPVPDWTAELIWEGGSLREVVMRRLAGTAEPVSAGETALDAVTALARFLEALNREGYVCSQVTDMYAGYASSGTAGVLLTPTWYVETDTAPWRFAVDGYTGAVTAAG